MKNFERIERTIEFIESNLNEKLTLEQIADKTDVTMFYLTKLLKRTLGESVMEYVRKRRLTLASRELVKSDKPIIDVALDWGYESQEAFSRAFLKVFHETPAKFRERGTISYQLERGRLSLSALLQNKGESMNKPRLIEKESFHVIGIPYRGKNEKDEITTLWQDCACRDDCPIEICKPVDECWGLCEFDKDDPDGDFDYLVCREIEPGTVVPEDFTHKIVPAGRWLVFEHRGALDLLRQTKNYIYAEYLPNSEHEPDNIELEFYDSRFDYKGSPESVMEIWVKLK
ncbi:MAG TPA: AraC family transcriptional regulator [Caldisericia bacterium]|nr:AraC family transcriptional regulator [Caldisericia bacterium]HPF48741.1 AraC family transcriptional regulator [Caldisericia bacterium]HPI83599.1 AraC family transcriptional regulator [Caldisericia bacterium]HPQ93196.1 AraC family transcriptional regulator [Caldisericia bacterium]HRV74971.1 AraC family transcriptional regulator [Caldisericia bacterium]